VRDYLMPQLISQDQYDAWAAAGGSTLLERTAQKTKELRDSERAYRLEPDALRQLDELVEKARREREGV
jgi:trimethylamine:corrinoid methyltransferase-like protein